MEYPCPACKQKIVYSTDNIFRPFCSKRCKTEDLASWADGTYKVAGQQSEEAEEEAASLLNEEQHKNDF